MAPPSLRDVDPVEDLVSRLRLDHPARRRGAVVVEGPSDRKILARVLGRDRNAFFPAGGRANVLRCADAVSDADLGGVICVADPDFEQYEAGSEVTCLVFYDDADLEAMLVESSALDRVLEEWASTEKLARAGGPEAVRTLMRDGAAPMSALRSENARKGLGLVLDSFDLRAITNKDDGTVRLNALVNRVAYASRVPLSVVREALEKTGAVCPYTGRSLARGRDLLAILGVLLRRVIGTLNKHQTDLRFVERSLTLAVGEGDFDTMPFTDRYTEAIARCSLT